MNSKSDIDNDADLDIVAAGRVIPAKYPMPASSMLYINENGKYIPDKKNSIVLANASEASKGTNTGFINPNGGGVFQGNNSTTWSQTSDRRIKKNIVDNNTGLDAINKIQVRNFEYRTLQEITDFDSPESAVVKKQGTQLGAIAQEIEEILPDLITETSEGVKTLNADNLTWYLINAVKELSAEIKVLKGE